MSLERRESQVVNGCRLPAALVEAMQDGRWPEQPDPENVTAALGLDAPNPQLYPLESLRAVNEFWESEHAQWYIGEPDAADPPGDIDPTRSVLIGDLQPDVMLALDYRRDPESPEVICCYGNRGPLWITVADSIEAFIARLGL